VKSKPLALPLEGVMRPVKRLFPCMAYAGIDARMAGYPAEVLLLSDPRGVGLAGVTVEAAVDAAVTGREP